VLALQPLFEGSRHLRFVLDDQDLHIPPRYRVAVIFGLIAVILKGAVILKDAETLTD
jgi:hypothetical protein